MNWGKKCFTLDSEHARAVNEAFIELFSKNLIYRQDHLVNWCCVLQSAISDIEVEHVEIKEPTSFRVPGHENPIEFGRLYFFAYKVCDAGKLVIFLRFFFLSAKRFYCCRRRRDRRSYDKAGNNVR